MIPLSPRQRQVFALLLEGRANKEIARELGIAAGTVKVHVEDVLSKLRARNRIEIVTRYMRPTETAGQIIEIGIA